MGIVAAVHAGWRVTVVSIARKTVAEMCRLGAEAGSICAAIGLCIRFNSYKVREDFRQAVTDGQGSINDYRRCTYTESDMFNSQRASQSKNCSLSGIML